MGVIGVKFFLFPVFVVLALTFLFCYHEHDKFLVDVGLQGSRRLVRVVRRQSGLLGSNMEFRKLGRWIVQQVDDMVFMFSGEENFAKSSWVIHYGAIVPYNAEVGKPKGHRSETSEATSAPKLFVEFDVFGKLSNMDESID